MASASQPVPNKTPATAVYADPKLPGFLRAFQIDLVLDVGANTGKFAQELIAAGYSGRIVSFEPLTEAHTRLRAASAGNPEWIVAERCALGAESGLQTIHIAGNLESSSLLEMLPAHVQAAPRSRYVGSEAVPVFTLDEIAADYVAAATAPFLKIDVQGFEDRVLRGAGTLLRQIIGLQVEMALVPLYQGEPVFESLFARIKSLGFELWWLRPGFSDPQTGRVLQLDGIFFRPRVREDLESKA